MGMVASTAHTKGKVKSAISPSETNVAQKTLRSIFLFYCREPHDCCLEGTCFPRRINEVEESLTQD